MTTEVKTDSLMLPKMGVAMLILLSIVTFGIYRAVWFLKRIDALNALKSEFKFSQGPFAFVIAGCVAHVGLVVYGLTIGKTADKELLKNLTSIADVLIMTVEVVVLFQCLKLRRAMLDHLGDAAEGIGFSWFWTIMFNVFYVQYKINRIDLEVRREA